ncbi:hypothetical protein MPSEU_000136900 [Mayamaea pseudoterrestris]|nr:hypothetical protein MPSEU_000136900 [Mayamaea pseudoterrestris]
MNEKCVASWRSWTSPCKTRMREDKEASRLGKAAPSPDPTCSNSLDDSASSFLLDQLGDDQFLASGSCELYKIISKKRWQFAEKRLERFPLDVFYIDPVTAMTPLSLACRNKPPARFIRKLLGVTPRSAIMPDDSGNLPLHYACRENASLDVLKELLTAHPDTAAVLTTKAIHAKGSDSAYQTPMTALWEGRKHSTDIASNYATIFWQKMELLLRRIAMHRGDESLVLHAAASLGVTNTPKEIWDYLLSQYSHQAFLVDKTGRLPLHYAALSAMDMTISEASIADKYRPRQEQVLYRLLDIHPQAARFKDPNEHGRWILHTALLRGHVWQGGVKELFEAAPDAVLHPDPITRLMPCQLSQDLNTIYRLVRVHPSVMEAQMKTAAAALRESKRDNNRRPAHELIYPAQSKPNLYQSGRTTDSNLNRLMGQTLLRSFEEESRLADDVEQELPSTPSTNSACTKTKHMTQEDFMANERIKLKRNKKKRPKKSKRATDDDVSRHNEIFVSPAAQSLTGLFYGRLRSGLKYSQAK